MSVKGSPVKQVMKFLIVILIRLKLAQNKLKWQYHLSIKVFEQFLKSAKHAFN